MAVTIILPLRFVRLTRWRKLEHQEAQTIRDETSRRIDKFTIQLLDAYTSTPDSNMADEMEIGKVRYYHQHVIGMVTRKTRWDKI